MKHRTRLDPVGAPASVCPSSRQHFPCHAALRHAAASTGGCPIEIREFLASVVENLDDAVIGKGLDGRILSWSRGAERLYGYRPEEVMGRPISILVPNGTADDTADILAAARQGQAVRHYETLQQRKDGGCISVSLTVSPIRGADGTITGVSTIARDISERMRSATVLNRLNRALHALIAVQEALAAAPDEEALLARACDILVEAGGYRMVWAGRVEDDAGKDVRPVAHAGYEVGYLAALGVTWADTERGRGPAGMAVRTGQPVVVRDTATDPTFGPWRDEALRRGYASVAALPVRVGGTVHALVAAYAGERDAFDTEEVDLLMRLAGNVGYGIEGLRARRERERASEALVKFSMAVEQAADSIVITNREGIIEYVNPAFERATGYTTAEAVGQTPRILKSGMHAPAVYGELWDALLSGQPWRGTLINRRKDGGLQYEDKAIVPLKDGEGQITHFVATSRDITERVRAQETQARLAGIIEAMPHLVATADVRGRLLTLNHAGREMLGIAADIPLSDIRLEDLYPEGARETFVSEALPAALREGMWTGSSTLQSAGAKEIPVSQVLLAHRRNGAGAFLSLMAQDLTEQRRLEDELRQAQKMEAVGRLAGGVAHDFNNLLTPILTYGGLLLMHLSPEDKLRRYAEQVVKTAERAASLPRQLLAFSRRQVIEPKVIDLNALVRDMEKMLRRLIGEDIDLTFTPGDGLGSVKADPGQIEQVLMNLVVNARDAMPEGGSLKIATGELPPDAAYARQRPGVEPGRHVVLSVSDTGCGMDRETQSRIFEPFFTTKEEGKGTGLGLSTVYGIVTQSGGHIRVTSEVGRGTTFDVLLPRVDEAAEQSAASTTSTELPRGTETVLVVEDDEGVRRSATEFLSMAGYAVLDAMGGEDALAQLERHDGPIHLLFTDVRMPGMSGRDLAAQAAARRPQAKVLYTSGHTDSDAFRHGELSAGVAFIQKPYAPGALLRKTREVLDGGDGNSTPRD